MRIFKMTLAAKEILKITVRRTGRVAQVVERIETLSSNPNTDKKKISRT
jgi:hypothetical protein